VSFAADVREGLSHDPKRLPPRWFYDDLGSRLFGAICALPWYRVTRAELGLLAGAARVVRRRMGRPGLVVELGCGTGEKLALLLDGLLGPRERTRVALVDVSREALAVTTSRLAVRAGLSIQTFRADYESGLGRALLERTRGPALVVFLGSNVGNFDPPQARSFLTRIHRNLRPGDGLLLGADLVKPKADLVLAYDDPLGVTASFNKNLLRRMNDELGARFDLGSFRHHAVWDARRSRVEMHLVSCVAQSVEVPGARLTARFRRGETIFTEASYKYTESGLRSALGDAGFRCERSWIDEAARFSLSLFNVP
jgi:L-histidine N-alpha-methyltransferase